MSSPTKKIGGFLDSMAAAGGAPKLGSTRFENVPSISSKAREMEAEADENAPALMQGMGGYDAEMRSLYTMAVGTLAYIDSGGTIENDPLLRTPEILRQKKKDALQKKRRLRQAKQIFKLNDGFINHVAAKDLSREEWEKRYSARQNKRYWRHKQTGMTSLTRPYVNKDVVNEDDSTEESEVELDNTASTAFSSSTESSDGSDGGSSDSDNRSGSYSGGSSTDSSLDSRGRRRSLSRSSRSSRSRTNSNVTDSTASPTSHISSSQYTGSGDDETRETSQSGPSSVSNRDDRSNTSGMISGPETATTSHDSPTTRDTTTRDMTIITAHEESAHAEGDTGLWSEKMSSKWGIPYWQNRSTKHVLWHCPSTTAPGSPNHPLHHHHHHHTLPPSPYTEHVRHEHHKHHAHHSLEHMHEHGHGHSSESSPGSPTAKPSRYYVTKLRSLQYKMEEKQRKHQREETAKWVMKYSVVHDGFYYKHKETKELSWEDPRLALLDQSDMEAFLTTRNSLRSSMRSEAIQQQYHTRESNAYTTTIHTLINDKNYVNTIAEGEEHNDEKSESNSGGSLAKDKGRNAVLWKEKFSTEYGLNYYKHVINGTIVWEDPR